MVQPKRTNIYFVYLVNYNLWLIRVLTGVVIFYFRTKTVFITALKKWNNNM